jgi:hypothetical protein
MFRVFHRVLSLKSIVSARESHEHEDGLIRIHSTKGPSGAALKLGRTFKAKLRYTKAKREFGLAVGNHDCTYLERTGCKASVIGMTVQREERTWITYTTRHFDKSL